ncbi:MAG: hypothetical protein AAF125_03790 [Chloroflexota bacterium]
MPQRVHIATVITPTETTARVSTKVSVGALVRYLAHTERNLNAVTAEVATPVRFSERTGEIDLRGGDRLLLTLRPPQAVNFPTPPQTGDVLLHLESGGFHVSSRGKQGLLVGVPEGGRNLPDVDLRRVIPPSDHPYLSRAALWLSYVSGQWFVARIGRTLATLDGIELNEKRVPISNGQRLTFYRGSGDGTALGELRIRLETVTEGAPVPPLEAGAEVAGVRMALEAYNQTLRVSEAMPIDQMVNRLAAHNDLHFTPGTTIHRLRLVPPGTRITALELGEDAFVYIRYTTPPSGLTLQLRDPETPAHVFQLAPTETDALLGTRLQPNEHIPALDVDLYELFTVRGGEPYRVGLRTPFLARLRYVPLERTWWVRPADRLPVGVYVNTTRVGTGGAPLTAGDVLTLGENLQTYYARLNVDTSSETGTHFRV